jgi:excisionase family DNA binding protein
MSPLVHTIAEACSDAKVGRTALYEAIRSGALRAVKRGKRTLILNEDLRQWVYSLPPLEIKARNRNRGGSCRKEPLPVGRADKPFGSVPGE